MPHSRQGRRVVPLLLLSGAWAAASPAARAQETLEDLSLEALLAVEVTSVARKSQKLNETASAVFVITADDIRRSGAINVPEALRMAPGMEVARIDAHTYAVSIRGFNNRFSNRLLVLIDGVSVYTPTFSGVFWDQRRVALADVERIEIIRGPGATIWGANAVNGVINIITKQAQSGAGVVAEAAGGNDVDADLTLQVSTGLGEKAALRLTAHGSLINPSTDLAGNQVSDRTQFGQLSARFDASPSPRDQLQARADLYWGNFEQRNLIVDFVPPFAQIDPSDGGFVGGQAMINWGRDLGARGQLNVQSYYERSIRRQGGFDFDVQIADFEASHRFGFAGNEIIWGLGYRLTDDDDTFEPSSLAVDQRTDHRVSGFVQTETPFAAGRAAVTLGVKLDYNTFSGFEVQPSARVIWNPNAATGLWAAVSRAVRTPSRFEDDIDQVINFAPPGSPFNPTPLPAFIELVGNTEVEAENVVTVEAGWRQRIGARLRMDVTAYYARSTDLIALNAMPPALQLTPAGPSLVQQFQFENAAMGGAGGVEAALDVDLTSWARLRAAYSYLSLDLASALGPDLPVEDATGFRLDASASPNHQASLRAGVDLPGGATIDGWARYVGALEAVGIADYVDFDLRVAAPLTKTLSVALVGQNLLNRERFEFQEIFTGVQPRNIRRQVLVQVTARF